MLGQAALILHQMLDGVRRRRQLGEDKNSSEKQVAQEIHGDSLIDLDEQAFEIFAFRKVQGYRMISSPGQATYDARYTTGIVCRPGDDFLEQLQTDAAGT